MKIWVHVEGYAATRVEIDDADYVDDVKKNIIQEMLLGVTSASTNLLVHDTDVLLDPRKTFSSEGGLEGSEYTLKLLHRGAGESDAPLRSVNLMCV
jgi:hypothetical protein